MLKLKKYANGQFFDTINKKYIKIATLKEMVQKGEEIKVTLTKSGKDITASVIEQFSRKTETPKGEKTKKSDKAKKTAFINTDSLKKWAGKIIDNRITQVLDTIKLPSKKQIEQLDANIKALNKKIDKLELLQKRKTAKAKTSKKTSTPEAEERETSAANSDTAKAVAK